MSEVLESTLLVRGAGYIDPNSALDTGEYVAFLCTLGYPPSLIFVFIRGASIANCSRKFVRSGDLNYPAFGCLLPAARVRDASATASNSRWCWCGMGSKEGTDADTDKPETCSMGSSKRRTKVR